LDGIEGDVHARPQKNVKGAKRCALKATTAAAAVRQCVGLNSAAKEKCFRSDLIHCYHPRLVFTHTQVDRTLLHDANTNSMRGTQNILYIWSEHVKNV